MHPKSGPSCKRRVRPASQPDFPQSAWYNVFALHQNRMAHAGSNKDFMKEGFLPRFLDFVVWGHEHECISEPWVNPRLVVALLSAEHVAGLLNKDRVRSPSGLSGMVWQPCWPSMSLPGHGDAAIWQFVTSTCN